jgi:ferredoxin
MRLSIDPVACDGLGMCAHQAPDVIELDPWGYPVISQEQLEGAQADQAQHAIRACPRKALYATV